MNAMKWVGSRPNLRCFAFKKEAQIENSHQTPVRIAFRWETVWCIKEDSSLILNDGSKFGVIEFHTLLGHLIGPSDPYATGLGDSAEAKQFSGAVWSRYLDMQHRAA